MLLSSASKEQLEPRFENKNKLETKEFQLKKLIFLAVMMMATAAFAGKKEYYEVQVDWTRKHLEESVVLLCDDSYYSGVDLIIPGREQKDFWISKESDLDWTLKFKKQIKLKDGAAATLIRLDGGTDATIKIQKGLTDQEMDQDVEAPIFTVEIHEAC